MGVMNLQIKAKYNFEVARYAERKQYYDVAISRFYYYMYQNIMYYTRFNKIYIDKKYNENLHIRTLGIFIKDLRTRFGLNPDEISAINKLQKLRIIRNSADYHDDIKDKISYEKEFKDVFNDLNEIFINKLKLWKGR